MKRHNRFLVFASAGLLLFAALTIPVFGRAGAEAQPADPTAPVKTGIFGESPALNALVKKGELPPVNERLPLEPSVAKVLGEIGQYGGTVNVFALNNSPWNALTETTERGHYILQLMDDGSIQGDLALDWEMSPDGKIYTIYLREGMKWSDGAPFTADDVIFTYQDLHDNPNVETWGGIGELDRGVKALDEYTLRFEASEPAFIVPLRMAQWPGGTWANFLPKHYLQKWHIKYNPEADKLAKEEGFANWGEAIHSHFWWDPQTDLSLPTMQAWKMVESTTILKVFERNPYYWRVDPEGNQLPYIDKIVSSIVDAEVYQLKTTAGEADMAFGGTSLVNYTLYKESERSGDYRVVTLPNVVNGAEPSFGINQNHPDPVMRKINQDVRYRRALSLAIDRDEINKVVFFDLGVPRQATVTPDTLYYKEEWAEAYAQYDPKEANRLLDEVGLAKRDGEGFRLRPDGKPLELILEYQNTAYTPALELAKEFWNDVDLRVQLKLEEFAYFNTRWSGSDHEIMVAGCYAAGEVGNYINRAEFWRPNGSEFSWGTEWENWLSADEQIKNGTKTLADFGGKMPGEEPPADIKQIMEWISQRGKVPYGGKEYIEISQKIFDLHMEKLYMIGTVGLVPWVTVVKNRIGNYPSTLGGGYYHWLHINWFADQFYVKQ